MDKISDRFDNKDSHKSPLALTLIILTLLLFGLFYLIRYPKNTYPVVDVTEVHKDPSAMTSSLEASAEAIYIGDYSDSL